MATITKLPSGKYRAQVRKRGFYRNETFNLKRQAVDWATRYEAQIVEANDGLLRTRSTLGELIDNYKASVPPKGRTWENYLAAWKNDLGSIRVDQLQHLHIQDWADSKMEGGTKAVTISGYLSTLAKVLDWARHTRRLDVSGDVVRGVRSALAHAGHRTRSAERERLPTDSELKRLYKHWADNDRRIVPMEELTRFALSSAMRQGEICRIRFEDVDWKHKTVIIRDRKDPKEKKGNDQEVPLLGEAWKIVEKRRGSRKNPQGRIFPYNGFSVSAAFTRTTTRLGIDDLRFQDFRHAGITRLFQMGLDIPLVSIVSGHKDWKNLKRYTQIGASDVHARLKVLGI
jgi:integrase